MNLTEFGKQLQALRKARQWSQEALIEALDELARSGPPAEYRVIDGTLLSRWERAHTQKGRTWKPTRTYMLHLIRLFAPQLDLARAQAWADQAGYAISAAELQTWFPPSTAADASQLAAGAPAVPQAARAVLLAHNLPTILTSFVGREAEVVRLVDHLSTATKRLVTLVGEGGVGKTRLALHMAHTVVDQALGAFGDGVYFVALTGVNATDFVVSAIANTLGLTLTSADNPEQQLLAYLRTRRLLLVLDNFEQLVGVATPLLTAILEAAPAVHLFVTSRERLNLAEEWILALSGLPFPTGAGMAGQEQPAPPRLPANGMAEVYGAVQLFMARAQQADAQFEQQDDPVQSAAIARICALLQGVPLGIEMAAAWVHMLSCTQIADEIAHNLDFLALPHRNAAPRHRSMRAVFEHSWRLLSTSEQAVLAALSVFQGGFTRAAAAQVAGVGLLTLRSLIDKSLLRLMNGRYELHELLRQFAAEQLSLTAAGHDAVLLRHSHYYLHFLTEREHRLAGEAAHQAADEIQTEFNNIRQAWSWAATNLRFHDLENSAYAFYQYYLLRRSASEGEHLFGLTTEQIRAVVPPHTPQMQAQRLLSLLLSIQSLFLNQMGLYPQSHERAAEAVTAAEACLGQNSVDPQNQYTRAFAHRMWGLALIDLGEFEQAHLVLEEAIRQLVRFRQDAPTTVQTGSALADDVEWQLRLMLGINYSELGDYPLARKYLNQALHLCQTSGKVRGQLICLGNLGNAEYLVGDYVAARQVYEQALLLAYDFHYRWSELANLVDLGDVVRLQGEYGLAQELIERGWSLVQEMSVYSFVSKAVTTLGLLYSYLGDFQQAQKWLDQGQALDGDTQGQPRVGNVMLALQQNAYSEALNAATQIWQAMAKPGNRLEQASVLVLMGHAQAALQLWLVATDAYTQALSIYTALNRPALAAEAQAGLAAVALTQGDMATAVKQVEAILPVLAEAPYVGIDEPFYTYWVCYRVLTAMQDERAMPLLASANRRLEQYASHIYDDALRQSFWENVAVHRDLRAVYLQRNRMVVSAPSRAELSS